MVPANRLRGLLVVCALGCAQPAIAQVQVQGLGGATNAANRAPFFGGAVGFKITFIEIDIEAGRFRNLLPREILDAIHDFEASHGLLLQDVVTVPATYVTGNLRFIWPTGVFQPFAVSGFGIAHVTPQFSIELTGLPSSVLQRIDIGTQTATMALVGGGLRLDFHAVNVEGGYRYVGIFGHFEGTTNLTHASAVTTLQTVYGAIAIRF